MGTSLTTDNWGPKDEKVNEDYKKLVEVFFKENTPSVNHTFFCH